MALSLMSLSFLATLPSHSAGHLAIVANRTISETQGQLYTGYVSDPAGRGTWSLIFSCLLTLVLCVWSALHLNVPPPSQSRLQSLWLNIRWITTGIYAPELVVFTAWRQWSSARILSRVVSRQIEDQKTTNYYNNNRRAAQSWTLTHSFFASTGGFAFEFEDDYGFGSEQPPSVGSGQHEYSPVSERNVTRATITARGMELLAKCGYLPDIPVGDIADKSKANTLAKFLVVLQASWMLLQVIGRLVARLPVTLLEVNTVAHVLCAFMMYAMWWHKPLTAQQPIILREGQGEELFAFMYMSSEMSGHVSEIEIRSQTVVKTLFASLDLYSKTPEIESLCYSSGRSSDFTAPSVQRESSFSRLELDLDFGDSFQENSTATDHQDLTLRRAQHFQRAPRRCMALREAKRTEKEAGTAFFERRPRVNGRQSDTAQPDPSTLRRWEQAALALEKYPEALAACVSFTHSTAHGPCVHFKSQQLVTIHSHNWPGDDLLRDVGGLVVGMILWLANFLYGGIHAAAWNEHFPSAAEKWLWRVSASYIGFCGGLWVVLNFVVSSTPWLNEFWEKWMDGEKKWWHNVVLGALVFVCGLTLMGARAYIVVEAFLSMRQLPVEAYATPGWVQVIPHL